MQLSLMDLKLLKIGYMKKFIKKDSIGTVKVKINEKKEIVKQ